MLKHSQEQRLNPAISPLTRARGKAAVCVLLPLLCVATLGACEPGGAAEGASLEELESRSAAALGERSGVSVRVAGSALCRSCTRQELAALWRVAPRRAFPKEDVDQMWFAKALRAAPAPDLARYRWQVKFVDEARVRRDDDGLMYRNQRRSMPQIDALLEENGVQMSSATEATEAELDELAIRAMRNSLRAQPDLGGIYKIDGDFPDVEAFLAFGKALGALEVVEYVEIEDTQPAPPGDIPPETADFSNKQGYLREASGGVGAPFAWDLGIFGQGVKVSDCEFSWDVKHEEFTDKKLNVEKGQTLTSSFKDHGTAVMGVTSAPHNGYGVKGIAPKAEAWVYPEKSQQSSSRRLAAVTNAIKNSGKGDIVMLEMQMTGPGGDYGPAEVTKSIWSATKTGTDAGVVVIGAAGNGKENLDSSAYSNYRARGDSGLIMVGAGSADSRHSSLSFSTYGKRVDVQGWGTGVMTAGYGNFKRVGGDSHQSYSSSFNGTSSATPVVVGAALLIQSHAKENLGKPYTPKELRELLKKTGKAQGGGRPIGPFPDVKAAINSVSEPEKNPPEVEITKPSGSVEEQVPQGEDGPGVVELRFEVDAKDDSRVKEVYLEVDGKKEGDADKEAPYVFDLELAPGKYEITAVAVDRYDNKASSGPIKVKIKGSESGDGSSDDSDGPSKGDGTSDEPSDDGGGGPTVTPGESEEPTEESDDSDTDSEDSSSDASGTKDPEQDGDEGGGCRTSARHSLLWSATAWLGLLLVRLRRRES